MAEYYDIEYQPEYLERRSVHRVQPSGLLAVWMSAPQAAPACGQVLEMSAGGMGIAAPLATLAFLGADQVVELTIGDENEERVVTPARIVSALPIDEHWARYGVFFVNVGGLDRQLEAFYQTHFNRRAGARARPLSHDVVRAQLQWHGGQLTARVHDVSTGGLALSISPRSPITLAPDTPVALRFRLPGAVRSITGSATVRYTATLPHHRVIGLEFDLGDPQGIPRDMPLIQAFVQEQLGRVETWESTWTS